MSISPGVRPENFVILLSWITVSTTRSTSRISCSRDLLIPPQEVGGNSELWLLDLAGRAEWTGIDTLR